MNVPTYGTAIRKRKSKRILDVDLSHDREVAERLVAQQNAKDAIRASRVEWVVVEIRALEPAVPEHAASESTPDQAGSAGAENHTDGSE